MARIFKLLLLPIIAAFALAACDVSTVGPRLGSGPLKVALLVPSGSSDARINSLASTLVSAANLAVSEAPEAKIEMTVFPTQGTVEGAVAAAQAAVAGKNKIILGPLYGDNAVAVAQEVASSGLLVLSFSNNSEISGGNLYVMGQTFEDTAARLIGYSALQGRSRALAVVPKGAAGDLAANAVSRAAAATGVTYAGKASYEFSQAGIQRGASSIVGQINSTGSDIVVMSANPAGALPLLAQSLGEAGINVKRSQVVGLARWDVPASTMSLVTLQGGLFALPNIQAATDFANRFQSFAGVPPQLVTGVSYDAMKVITTQLEKGISDALSPAQLSATVFSGATGFFRLNAAGQTRRELAIARAAGGSYSIVDQPDISVEPGL